MLKRNLITAILAVTCAIQGNFAFAQGIEAACKDLITSGLKEYSISTRSDSYLRAVFDRYCSASGTTNSSSLGLGLDLVIKALPVSITGTYSTNEQAMSNFCRAYAEHTESQSNEELYQERIVDRAYDSFDACIQAASTGVVLKHTVRDFNDVDFFLAPGYSRPVTLRGLKAPANVSCEGQDPTKKTSPDIKFNLHTHIVLNGYDQSLNIACTRTGTKGANGSVRFDEATITLMTNLPPDGNYSAYLPRDTKLAEDQASQIASEMDRIRQENEALKHDLGLEQNEFLSGVISGVGGCRGDNGCDHEDVTVAFKDSSGKDISFKSVPRVVATIDKQGGQDGLGWSLMLLNVSKTGFTLRVRVADPSIEGNTGWNGNVGVQWIAYSRDSTM